MKILIFSDLHLCDKRNSLEYEENRKKKLAEFIKSTNPEIVVNLGDTVSRKEFLRDNYSCEADAFDTYLEWRKQFEIPFIECSIEREFDFFAQKMKQPMDHFYKCDNYMSIITVAPKFENDHNFSSEQILFIKESINNCTTPNILIASHVPYPGSCSRPIAQGIFLTIPEELRKHVEESTKKIFWCGGHFHWQEEAPKQLGSLTAFYGGRFNFENHNTPGYMRIIDTQSGEISTILSNFNW